jgi:hypothetical protein
MACSTIIISADAGRAFEYCGNVNDATNTKMAISPGVKTLVLNLDNMRLNWPQN